MRVGINDHLESFSTVKYLNSTAGTPARATIILSIHKTK